MTAPGQPPDPLQPYVASAERAALTAKKAGEGVMAKIEKSLKNNGQRTAPAGHHGKTKFS